MPKSFLFREVSFTVRFISQTGTLKLKDVTSLS